jgi:hypothetical protein
MDPLPQDLTASGFETPQSLIVSPARRTRQRPRSAPGLLPGLPDRGRRAARGVPSSDGGDSPRPSPRPHWVTAQLADQRLHLRRDLPRRGLRRFDRSARASRHQPASRCSTSAPPNGTALPPGRSPPAAMSRPEQPDSSCSRPSCFSAITNPTCGTNTPGSFTANSTAVIDQAPPGPDEHRPCGRVGKTSVPPRPATNVISRSKPLRLPQR